MSQNSPNQELTHAGNPTATGSDSNIVDRTQQLIDEVNQLLGAGTGISAPTPNAATSSAPAATQPAETEPAPVAAIPAAAPIPVEPAPVEPPQPPVLETPEIEPPTEDAPVAATPEVPAASDTSSELSSFLDGLMRENSPPVAQEATTPDVETEVVATDSVATDPAEATTAPIVEHAETTLEPEATLESDAASESDAVSEGGFNISALNDIFQSTSQEASSTDNTLETTLPETPAASVVAEVPVEETETSGEITEPTSELESPADVSLPEPSEAVVTEATEATVPASVEQAVAVEEVSAIESAAEETPEDAEDKRSFTEKYLEQFRSSFDEDATETESPAPVASEPVAEPPAPSSELETDPEPESDPEPEQSAAPVSAEMSVENWLAKNIGNSSDEEAEDESDSVAPAASEPTTEESSPVETSQVFDLGNDEDDSEEEAAPAHDFASLEASFTRRIRKLENRIGSMVNSLSAQLENGVATKPQDIDDTPVDAMSAGEVEDLRSELKEKLRKAEVELSINRAKMSQQTVQLEQLQADLERREAALEQKLQRQKASDDNSEDGETKGSGLMDRWKRHLG